MLGRFCQTVGEFILPYHLNVIVIATEREKKATTTTDFDA